MLDVRNVKEAEDFEAAVLSDKETRELIQSWDPLKGEISLSRELRSICDAYSRLQLSSETHVAVYNFRQSIFDGSNEENRDLHKLSLGSLKQYRLLQHFYMYKEQMKLTMLKARSSQSGQVICENIWKVRFLQELCECYEKGKSRRAAKQMFLNRIMADITKEEKRWHNKVLNMSLLSPYANKVATLY